MNADEKQLVRETFALVKPIAAEAAALFYSRLFEIAPAVRSLFKHDMDEQGKKLMQMIGVAVANLDNLDVLVPAVEALGARHHGYGVTAAHYAPVGEALLWTLEQGLGDAFSPDERAAWTTVYGVLSTTMISAAP